MCIQTEQDIQSVPLRQRLKQTFAKCGDSMLECGAGICVLTVRSSHDSATIQRTDRTDIVLTLSLLACVNF